MHAHIDRIIKLIKLSDLDQTIKDILIRDLQSEGLTDFLREQIIAYCIEGLKKHDPRIAEADRILRSGGDPAQLLNTQNPA